MIQTSNLSPVEGLVACHLNLVHFLLWCNPAIKCRMIHSNLYVSHEKNPLYLPWYLLFNDEILTMVNENPHITVWYNPLNTYTKQPRFFLTAHVTEPQEPSVEDWDHLTHHYCMISCHTGWWVAVSTMRCNNPSDRWMTYSTLHIS